MKLKIATAILCILTTMSSEANAKLLKFDIEGSRQATFEIDTQKAPDTFSSSFVGKQIQYENVSGVFGGVAETATIGFGTFLLADLNISAAGLGFTQFAGPDLFSGDPAKPEFSLGVFALRSIVSGSSTLTISAGSAAPEPSTWAMMLLGVGGLGFIARRRHVRGRRLQAA